MVIVVGMSVLAPLIEVTLYLLLAGLTVSTNGGGVAATLKRLIQRLMTTQIKQRSAIS
jgi:hypothetical protein